MVFVMAPSLSDFPLSRNRVASYDRLMGRIRAESEAESGAADRGEAPLFDVVLHPHASLGLRGFFILMATISLVSFAAGAAFISIGAWPVFGFFGLDVVLIFIAFRVNYYRARMFETVRLTRDRLVVERNNPRGDVTRWEFQPYWLRVTMDDPPRPESRLMLSSHGRSVVIGRFLTPDERLDLAQALRNALARLRGITV